MATAAGRDEKIEIGRVVGRGFDVLGRQFGPFFLLALLLSGVPSAIMNGLMLRAAQAGDTAGPFGDPAYWAAWLLTIVCGYLLQAAIVRSAVLQLNGRPSEIAASLAGAVRLLLPMIGLAILSTLLFGIGLLLLIVPGVIAYLMLIVSVPVLVEEGGVIHSMRRSRELTRGSRGRIFLLLLLFLVVYGIAFGIGGAVTGALLQDSLVGQAIVQGLASALTTLIMSAMLASLYFELRSIKEGATVSDLAEVFA